MRVTLDTNVPIAALLKPGSDAYRLIQAAREGRITLVTSEPLLEELADVAVRPYFRGKGVSPEAVAEMIVLLRQISAIIPVQGNVTVCEDPDDNIVIETAVHGGVMMLVTADKHLTRAKAVADYLDQWGIKVVSITSLLAILDHLAGQES